MSSFERGIIYLTFVTQLLGLRVVHVYYFYTHLLQTASLSIQLDKVTKLHKVYRFSSGNTISDCFMHSQIRKSQALPLMTNGIDWTSRLQHHYFLLCTRPFSAIVDTLSSAGHSALHAERK